MHLEVMFAGGMLNDVVMSFYQALVCNIGVMPKSKDGLKNIQHQHIHL